MTTYRTSLDNIAKGITLFVTILFAFIIIKQYALIKDAGRANPMYTTVLLLLIYFFAFGFRPINYQVTQDSIIVHRLFTNIQIDRNQISSVQLLEKGNMGWSLRIMGSGGLFGYFGIFRNTKLGSMTWYATRRNGAVLIRTIDDRKIILTPDDPENFVAEFNA